MTIRKNKTLPKAVSIPLVFLFFGHFIMVMVSNLSGTYLPEKFWYKVEWYTVPLFHQNFKIFAPEPPTASRTFLYRYKSDEVWSRWHVPALPHLNEAHINRFSSHSELFDIHEALADNLIWTIQKDGFNSTENLNELTNYPAFELAYSVAKELALENTDSVDSVQVAVLVKHTSVSNDSLMHTYQSHVFQKAGVHE